jgi:hypothetical protein
MDTHDVMRVRRPWSRGALYLVIAATVLTGCASLPNVAPFTDATVKLTSAARSAGHMTVEDVLRAADTVLPQNKATLKDKADELKDAWAKHVAALEAASDYARSLQSVVDAANQSRQSVQNIADAAKDLADKVGLAVPATGTASAVAVGVATDAIKLAVTQINNARGRKTLTEAMEDLVPAIDQVASVFKASLGDLGKIVDASSQLQLNWPCTCWLRLNTTGSPD